MWDRGRRGYSLAFLNLIGSPTRLHSLAFSLGLTFPLRWLRYWHHLSIPAEVAFFILSSPTWLPHGPPYSLSLSLSSSLFITRSSFPSHHSLSLCGRWTGSPDQQKSLWRRESVTARRRKARSWRSKGESNAARSVPRPLPARRR